MLVVIGLGLFATGLVWRPMVGDGDSIKYALECTSYIATAVAAIVAITALSAWRDQFRYTERFKCLTELKEAAADLSAFSEYLHDYYTACFNSIPNGGTLVWKHSDDGSLAKWYKALDRYKRVWTTARVFLTEVEMDYFSGKPEDFDDLYARASVCLPASFVNHKGSQKLTKLMECYQEVHQESWDLYKSTLKQAEELLKKSR
ncbi:hypothetical protein ACNFBR_28025 [Pseudomonas sp. NY11955]|uniref:hypothetical protein n=1 Tax=Pseudomonas sp. NY11955 TaxID=3400363 RepID=UPI003A86A1BF